MKEGLIFFFFLFDRVPAFLPQILFDLLAQCFQNQPCQQASAVLPLLGHRELSVKKDIWQVILKWAIKIRKRMIACSGIKEYLYTFVIEFLTNLYSNLRSIYHAVASRTSFIALRAFHYSSLLHFLDLFWNLASLYSRYKSGILCFFSHYFQSHLQNKCTEQKMI